jgi:hypothetical protein
MLIKAAENVNNRVHLKSNSYGEFFSKKHRNTSVFDACFIMYSPTIEINAVAKITLCA